jgi:hypothetical protein
LVEDATLGMEKEGERVGSVLAASAETLRGRFDIGMSCSSLTRE